MLPNVIIHNEISLDGRLDYMLDDGGLYYETIERFKVDAMLSGSNTIMEAIKHMQPSQYKKKFTPAAKNFEDSRQLLVVVDSQVRITDWSVLRDQPYWRDIVVLCSSNTPQNKLDQLYNQQIETIVTGNNKVDLRVALQELRSVYRVENLRVDSGGILNGVLLRAGLVNEIVVVINPSLVGGLSPRTLMVAEDLTSMDNVIPLSLKEVEQLRDGYLWLRYDVLLEIYENPVS